MKKRLVELIKQAENNFSKTGKPVLDIEEYVASYLLANGVIVPPCKVRQTVYQLANGYVEEERVIGTHTTYLTNLYTFSEKDFGKTVFLTREEAEKALKEREGKG